MLNLKAKLETKDRAIWLRLIGFFLGFQWFVAGIEKVLDPHFSTNLPKTLGFFASNKLYDVFQRQISTYRFLFPRPFQSRQN